jgi:regulator of protease activity HflC (stomatin/prohibitin superfamily)
VEISVGFYYRLRQSLDSALDLFFTYGDEEYELAYIRIARDVLRTVIARYTAFQLVYERTLIEPELSSSLAVALDGVHADVENFVLLDIVFPDSFAASITAAQEESLNLEVAENEKQTIEQVAEGEILQAETESQIIVNDAETEANVITLGAEADAIAMDEKISTKLQSYAKIKSGLDMTDKSMVAFQWIDTIEKLSESYSLKINLETPKKIQCIFEDSSSCV